MGMFEVAIHHYGRRLITQDGPCQGLLEWPQHQWARITPRPIGLARAKALADAQSTHATVQPWMTADVAYDNGKKPAVPEGWWPPNASSVMDLRRVALAMAKTTTDADLLTILEALQAELLLYAQTEKPVNTGRLVLWLSDVRLAVEQAKKGRV